MIKSAIYDRTFFVVKETFVYKQDALKTRIIYA